MGRAIRFLWQLATTASTVVWIVATFSGAAVTTAAIAYGLFQGIPKLVQFLVFVAMFFIVLTLATVAISYALEWRDRRKEARRNASRRISWAGPQNREELREWLSERIDELQARRVVLDKEASKQDPNIERTSKIESWFWDKLNIDVADKLELLAPERGDCWDEMPDWFFPFSAPGGRITSHQVAEFSRFLGSRADCLGRIRRKLRA